MSGLDPADVFRQEASELLDSLEGTLLDLGQHPADGQLVDAAFRAVHTIKGSGAVFGFDRLAAFTHDFETAFDLLRQGKATVSQELVQLALSARDHMRELVEDPGAADATVGSAILHGLRDLMATAEDAPSPIADEATPSPRRGWRLAFRFGLDALRNGTNPLALIDELRDLGECNVRAVLDNVPALADLNPLDLHMAWEVELVGECAREAVDDVFVFSLDAMDLVVEPLEPTPPPALVGRGRPAEAEAKPPGTIPPAEAANPERRHGERTASTVRVPAERLDELMDRVGELVIAQARLSQLAEGRADPDVKASAEEVERLASGLRDIAMSIRMVPIGSLFVRFRRLVDDLSRDLGKPVDLVTAGEETELDKTMIERLADPLVHLIRNAIDHGIESPDRRAATSKPARGRISLTARHVGAQVLITVEDDGGGLDAVRIRAKAEEKGLVVPGAALGEADTYRLLFHPGFSTAETVSALSGRGVGMDVVKRNVEALRGSIDLSTRPGHGATVALRLPLTLAIIEGLLVRVGDGRYVVPLSVIEECIALPPWHDALLGRRDLLDVRGRLVPLIRLRGLFEVQGAADAHQRVIVVSAGDGRVGLVVDAIVATHQIVIKSLSKLHADVTTFSGATILGDGGTALILDVARLVALGEARTHAELEGRAA